MEETESADLTLVSSVERRSGGAVGNVVIAMPVSERAAQKASQRAAQRAAQHVMQHSSNKWATPILLDADELAERGHSVELGDPFDGNHPLAYNGTEQFIARVKLKLRTGCDLDSEEIGSVPTSSFVNVLELANAPDGTRRAHVQMCTVTGVVLSKPGWVSYIGKDGRCNLIPFHWSRFQRKSHGRSSVAVRPSSVPGRRTSIATPSAYQAAARADASKSKSLSSEKVPQAGKSGVADAVASRGRVRAALRGASTSTPVLKSASRAVEALQGGDHDGGAEKTIAEQAKAKAEARALERFRVQTSAELRQLADSFRKEALSEEAKLTTTHTGLKVKLGEALFKTRATVSELVKSWSTKAEISKMEFRKHVRQVIEWQDVKDIDDLFQVIDLDGGGTLDAEELTHAMQVLRTEAKVANAHDAEIVRRVADLRSRAADVDEAVRVTEAAEAQEEDAKRLMSFRGVDALLGQALIRRSTKIADLVTAWESTNGHINLHQFRRNVRSMNIDADNESIDALFVSVDQDGGGSLDVSEIRQALEHWKQATAQADQRSVKLQKISSGMWKAAKVKQMELKQRFSDIEEAERAKVEAAAKLEQDKKDAEEAAKKRERARLQAVKERKREEAAEFEAKVVERRKLRALTGGPASPR